MLELQGILFWQTMCALGHKMRTACLHLTATLFQIQRNSKQVLALGITIVDYTLNIQRLQCH